MSVKFWTSKMMSKAGIPNFLSMTSVSGLMSIAEKTMWLPSSGGIGIRLKTNRAKLIKAAEYRMLRKVMERSLKST